MKKIIAWIIIILSLITLAITLILKLKEGNNSNLTKVTVGEVTHSIFYAPQYVALSKGYFEEEGLDVEIITIPGADKVTAAVLSGDVQIGFCGSEATIYVYNGGEKDYIKTFAGLTNKDGSFLVGRTKQENFKIEDLKGKHVIAGRVGGMPVMNFEWALRKNNINPNKDLNTDTSIEFASMQGAFISGIGDYVSLFEPNASNIEQEGLGYVVASIGEMAGNIPYTAYNAKKSYIEENKDIIEKFTKAIAKGLKYVDENKPEVIAKDILEYFPDTTLTTVTNAVKRYKEIDAWYKTPEISEQDFDRIQDIMIDSGTLNEKVDYKELVDTRFFTR
ncbi:MAG: ABC transporter substrate-binding protein [Firmicutes bacterium]|nr:ABC transporter substrate-binding protein [Bacillota bacterium]